MKYLSLSTILMLIFTCFQPAQAYSPFFSLEGDDAARLAKLGITITKKKGVGGSIVDHDLVEITYDTSKLRRDLDVYMVLQVIDSDREFVSAFRAERKKGEAKNVTMQIILDEKTVKHSHLRIGIPELLAAGLEREEKTRMGGNPGFGGYALSAERIMTLARNESENKKGAGLEVDINGKMVELTAPCRVSLSPNHVHVMVAGKDLMVELPEAFRGKFSSGDRAWIGLRGVCHIEPKKAADNSSIFVKLVQTDADGYIVPKKVLFLDQATGHVKSFKVVKLGSNAQRNPNASRDLK